MNRRLSQGAVGRRTVARDPALMATALSTEDGPRLLAVEAESVPTVAHTQDEAVESAGLVGRPVIMMGDGGAHQARDDRLLLMQPLARHASDSQMIMQWDLAAASARNERKRRRYTAASAAPSHSQGLLRHPGGAGRHGALAPLHACRILSYATGHFMNDMLAAVWYVCCTLLCRSH